MSDDDPRAALDAIYRGEAGRVRATLIRCLGSFDAAEEALHDAFVAAAKQWPEQGVPNNPYAWLVSTGRFSTISRWRRQARLARALPELAPELEVDVELERPDLIQDDELRLIFTCCHPTLTPDARVALTLREVAGLTTEEIARAYLTPTPTIAQRIVRAKAKIRDERIPYEVPTAADLSARLESVLQVVYLIFNEGYASGEGPNLTRDDLCREAIRLGQSIVRLLGEPEALGLLALMILHDARSAARIDADGELVLLERQNRSLWDRTRIREAEQLIERALSARRVGPYLLQAAIAAVHVEAPSFAETDWAQIVGLYDVLRRLDPSPVIALNRAVALGMRDGAKAGLAAIEPLIEHGGLEGYYLAHAARADLERRLGLGAAARRSYERALELSRQPVERRFLEARLAELRLGLAPKP
jgi:RNA polymerase sigma-70 factor (ECF subfamily)